MFVCRNWNYVVLFVGILLLGGCVAPSVVLPPPPSEWSSVPANARQKGFIAAKISIGDFYTLKARSGLGNSKSRENRKEMKREAKQKYSLYWKAEADTFHFTAKRTVKEAFKKDNSYTLRKSDGKWRVGVETELTAIDSTFVNQFSGHVVLRSDTVAAFEFDKKFEDQGFAFGGFLKLNSGEAFSIGFTNRPLPAALAVYSMMAPIQQWHVKENGMVIATWDVGNHGKNGTVYWSPATTEYEKHLISGFFALIFVGSEFFQ